MVHNSKKKYFSSTLGKYQHDSKSVWKSLKCLNLPSKRGSAKSCPNICLKIDGDICFKNPTIAQAFKKTVEKLQKSLGIYGEKFVTNFCLEYGAPFNSVSFSLVSEDKVLKHLKNLSPNKASDLDGLPSRFIKDCTNIIAIR